MVGEGGLKKVNLGVRSIDIVFGISKPLPDQPRVENKTPEENTCSSVSFSFVVTISFLARVSFSFFGPLIQFFFSLLANLQNREKP
jgi:hypothetical protein